LNPDHTISETNTAGRFAVKDKTVIVPESGHVFDSVTLISVLGIFEDKDYDICCKPIA